MNHYRSLFNRPFISLIAIASMLLSIATVGAQRQTVPAAGLKEDQRILHVLNRLGFGARPGDVARVKAMGLENYIKQQLNPASISDTVADATLKDLAALKMTTAQLYEKFPQPGLLLKQLERRGQLPDSLAAARENRVKGGNAAPAQANVADSMEMPRDGKRPDTQNENGEPGA